MKKIDNRKELLEICEYTRNNFGSSEMKCSAVMDPKQTNKINKWRMVPDQTLT